MIVAVELIEAESRTIVDTTSSLDNEAVAALILKPAVITEVIGILESID